MSETPAAPVLKLERMADADFQMYLRRAIPQYAYDQTRTGNWSAEEAMGRAQQEFRSILAQGPQTPNHFLYNIVDVETGQKVGMTWFVKDTSRARPTLFLADFFIFNEFRARHLEGTALSLLDAEARNQGVHRIEAQVFGHEDVALAQYHAAGFATTSIYLGKDLKE